MLTQNDRIRIEPIIAACRLRTLQLFHVVDFGARQLVRVFDRTLTLLLVADHHADRVVNRLQLSTLMVVITLVSVLIASCQVKD